MNRPIEFVCECGDRWRLTVPKKFQTKESGWFDYALTQWKKQHESHTYKITPPNFLASAAAQE